MSESEEEEQSEEPKLPTQEEIDKLPRWAIVAFAARCARRVQPIFTIAWPEAPQEHIEAVDVAITLAERAAAAIADVSIGTTHKKKAALAISDAEDFSDLAAVAAAAAALATADAAQSNAAADAFSAAANAARAAGYAPASGYTTPAYIGTAAVRRDFDELVKRASEERWDDDTAVDVACLGPLWPDGPPKSWPEEERRQAIERDRDLERRAKQLADQALQEKANQQIKSLRARMDELEQGLKSIEIPDHGPEIEKLLGLIEKLGEHVEHIQPDAQSRLESIEQRLERLDSEEANQEVRTLIDALSTHIDLAREESDQVAKMRSSAKSKLQQIETARVKAKAEAEVSTPKTYWKHRSWRHWWQFLAFGFLTIVFGFGGLLAVLNQDRFLAWVESMLPFGQAAVTTVQPSEDSEATQSDPQDGETANEDKTPTSPFKGLLGKEPWRLGQTALLGAMLLLLLRILTRITMSNLHLSTEAQERVVMAETYADFVALNRKLEEEGDAPSEEEKVHRREFRKLLEAAVIYAMFRPTTTGLVKDDSAEPAAFEELIRSSAKGSSKSG